ncbi:MAG: hypothetical protein WD771_09935 [Gemmatimonadaceae bacterium]
MDATLAVLLATQLLTAAPRLPSPTEVGRAQDVVYTDAYFKRLAIHRTASYAILPLFALQYAAGTQLYEKGDQAPEWAKVGHRIGATGVLVLFGTNVATGVPNLIAGRRDPNERARRFFHATMMLTASAGFAATGILSERAETSPDDRDLHRTVALTSVVIATVGYLSMLDLFRPD